MSTMQIWKQCKKRRIRRKLMKKQDFKKLKILNQTQQLPLSMKPWKDITKLLQLEDLPKKKKTKKHMMMKDLRELKNWVDLDTILLKWAKQTWVQDVNQCTPMVKCGRPTCLSISLLTQISMDSFKWKFNRSDSNSLPLTPGRRVAPILTRIPMTSEPA